MPDRKLIASVVESNMRFLVFMAFYYQRWTGKDQCNPIPIDGINVGVFEAKDTHVVSYINRTFLVFPIFGNMAQAYDCTTRTALHLKTGVRIPFLPAYAPECGFSAVGPFTKEWNFALALTKKEDRPVKITPEGKIIEEIPRRWLSPEVLQWLGR